MSNNHVLLAVKDKSKINKGVSCIVMNINIIHKFMKKRNP